MRRKEIVVEGTQAAVLVRFAAGKRPVPKSQLKKIDAVIHEDACISDPAICAQLVGQHFDCKFWKPELQKLENIDTWLSQHESYEPSWAPAEIRSAFAKIKHKWRLDADGICVASWEFLFIAQPQQFCSFINRVASSTAQLSQLCIHGRGYGKISSKTKLQDVRAILPLPSLLQILDCVLADALTQGIETTTPQTACAFFGCRPGTQCLDVAWPIQVAIEKMLDSHSVGAVASADIKQFYDHIPTLKAARKFIERGVHPAIAATFLRIHACVEVRLESAGVEVGLGRRVRGCLTGTRSAGCAGRLPVEDAVHLNAELLQRCSFKFGHFKFGIMSWIDNLFMIGEAPQSATAALEAIEDTLRSEWSLEYKDASRGILVPAGSTQDDAHAQLWPRRSALEVLGHHVADDGSLRPDWNHQRPRLWRAFWSCASSKALVGATLAEKEKAITRFVSPIGLFRWSRWPPQKQIANELNATQAAMLTTLLRIVPQAGETPTMYRRRRAALSRQNFQQVPLWSSQWFSRALAWHNHVLRHPESHSTRILAWHDSAWMRSRRQSLLPMLSIRDHGWTPNAGRTNTRVRSGIVQCRWEDGIAHARSHL